MRGYCAGPHQYIFDRFVDAIADGQDMRAENPRTEKVAINRWKLCGVSRFESRGEKKAREKKNNEG